MEKNAETKPVEEKPFQQLSLAIKDDLLRGWVTVDQGYCNTINVFDQAPKFFSPYSKVEIKAINFQYDGIDYWSITRPVRLLNDGREVLPGFREELVERVARFMAVQQTQQKEMLHDGAKLRLSMTCTLYEFRKVLKNYGHEMRVDQIREALEILSNCGFTLSKVASKRKITMDGPPLLNVIYDQDISKDDSDGSRTKLIIQFHTLVGDALIQLAYRPYNFERIIRLKNPLARWIATRMSHNYTQAAPGDHFTGNGYTLSLDAVINQSGTAPLTQHRNYLPLVKKALAELVTHDILYLPVAERKALNGRKWSASGVDPARKDKGEQIEEVTLFQSYLQRLFYRKAKTNPVFENALWTLFPSESFAQDSKQANRHVKAMKDASAALDCQATKDLRKGHSKPGQEAA